MLTLTVDCGAPACKGGGIEFKRVPAAQWRSDANALFDDDDRKAWYEDNDSDDEPPDWYEDEMFKKYQKFCDERGYGIRSVRSYEDDDYEALIGSRRLFGRVRLPPLGQRSELGVLCTRARCPSRRDPARW